MLARLTLAALPMVAGCTSIHADQRTLDGTLWHVAAIDGQATGPAHSYYMSFGQGRVSGRFGCNYFGGGYLAGGEVMTVQSVTATRMACAGPAGTHERAGFATLAEPMRMAWAGERVTLSNTRGSLLLQRAS